MLDAAKAVRDGSIGKVRSCSQACLSTCAPDRAGPRAIDNAPAPVPPAPFSASHNVTTGLQLDERGQPKQLLSGVNLSGVPSARQHTAPSVV